MARAALLLLAACCASGCTRAPRALPVVSARPVDADAARVIAMAADQIRRCYRAPRTPRYGRRIVTVLRVSFAPDGMLAETPMLVAERGVSDDNYHVATQLAEAAVLAVMRCTPLRLPPEQYQGGWDSFELTFSPRAAA